LKQHLHDPLFANTYFSMVNTRFSSDTGFFFWIFAAGPPYAAEAASLGSALISAMGHLSHAPLLGFDIGLDPIY